MTPEADAGVDAGNEAFAMPDMGDSPMDPLAAAEALTAAREKASQPETNEASEAGRKLASFRAKKAEAPNGKISGQDWNADQAVPEEPQTELAEEADSGPDEVPAETQESDQEAELPPIDAPRSWTKEDKELFVSLPRETQERIADRERLRERDFLNRQNEAAEKLKGLTAKEQQVEQARQQYEQALPMLLQTLQQAQQGEFADIKTMADVEKLAREDWPRYALWDAQQKKIAAMAQEVQAAQARQASEFEQKWNDFAGREDKSLIERAPELADKTRSQKVADSAVDLLRDVGFTEKELGDLWNGKASISLRDHRVQLLILDGVKYREAKANIAKPLAKPVKPVQRPGAAPDKGAASLGRLKAAQERLSNARGLSAMDAAVEMLNAQRAASGQS
ncbi:MAG: hypothetical protein ACM3IH_14075 [Sphingobacteriales bacterium]